MPTDKPRFTITLDDDMFKAIEDFQYNNRFPNRNMAINALLQAGIEVLKDEKDQTPKKPTRKKRKTNADIQG